MTLPNSISTILGTLFATLTTDYNWTSTEVNEAEAFIEESPLFVSQLAAMQSGGWTYVVTSTASQEPSPDISYSVNNVQGQPGETDIAIPVAQGVFPVPESNVDDLLTTMAYEAGHEEDPQWNTLNYLNPSNSKRRMGGAQRNPSLFVPYRNR